MKTIWYGDRFELMFENGESIFLNVEQTKEFEAWVKGVADNTAERY